MIFSLAIATVVRTLLVIISYGCKVPAGIFVPSMAIGASFGRMVGMFVQHLQESFPQSTFFSACGPDGPCITPGTYAFLGAAAALSGIMHITVSVVVIMFELTGALTYILPTMVRHFSRQDHALLIARRLSSVLPKPSANDSAREASLIVPSGSMDTPSWITKKNTHSVFQYPRS